LSAADRPDLIDVAWKATDGVLPEYNLHGDVAETHWARLDDERPEHQFFLVAGGDVVLARCCSIPLKWNRSVDDLPAGLDGALVRGFDGDTANTLCALLVSIPRHLHGRGISAAAVRAMREVARRSGLDTVIAPVRPNWKDRYPLVPIDRYARWRRPDGSLFDPWMRVHERLGATVVRPEPRSLRITGSVGEWEAWTQTAFPESGRYWFPGGLATVAIDRNRDKGSYWEPNVWMQHEATGPREGE
jgi:hypothetical protein